MNQTAFNEGSDGQAQQSKQLSLVLIHLLKGVIYAEEQPKLWDDLIDLQAQVRDYIQLIGLSLSLHEDEGFAWLETAKADDEEAALPKLVQRRQLSYPVSLLLALLRKKLAEHDSQSSDPRLIMSRDEIVEMIRTFLPDSSNDARVVDQIDSHINKVIDLGFARRLKGDKHRLEIRRIIIAFITAQWLSEFDQHLTEYHQYLQPELTDE
ncbi:MAG: DUF4194 domain-containing protein [Pseudomonadota bacterium]|nr:DUF4194 domain-containing protein [Pseudomonadota bacterium]